MTWLVPALYLGSALTTALAWVLAERKAEHGPIAYLLTVGLVSDVARRTLRFTVLHPGGVTTDEPFAGIVRFGAYAEAVFFLAWPFAIMATAVAVYTERRPWPVLVPYLGTVGAIAAWYPTTRGAVLAQVYTGAQLVCLMVALGCAVTWYTRSKEKTTTAQAALSLILSVELATIALSWRNGIFTNWHLSQVSYLLMFLVLILMQGGLVWSRSP